MLQQHIQRKQKSFALQRGLYVLRYESAADPSQPPVVTVVCEAGRNEVILHPEQARATMSAPGQALVIRANESGGVQVEIASSGHASTLDVTLKFEPLKRDAGGPVGFGIAAQAVAPQRDTLAGLQVLGHVARLGDVTVGPDQWLGGPTSPSRIEGFVVRWPGKPSDVSLRYAATIAGQRPGEARLVEAGEFAGSRGRARPLLGLMVELSGPGARSYQLIAEGLFLGAPSRRMSGSTVTLAGPTGREPLVGLRLAIIAQQTMQTAQPAYGYAAPQGNDMAAAPAAAAEPRRVRVFRA